LTAYVAENAGSSRGEDIAPDVDAERRAGRTLKSYDAPNVVNRPPVRVAYDARVL